MLACARCGETGLAHYWPEPGEPREPVKRAWLTGLGYGPAARCCSGCMLVLEFETRFPGRFHTRVPVG